jgi:metal-sulfur cluster biosynthetic enzyme
MDMGIVSSAHEHNGILDVTLQLTEPACIFGLGIAENVQRTLQRERGDISEVRVSFDYSEDVWTEERLSAVGRKKLELARLRDREADSDGSAINSRGEA